MIEMVSRLWRRRNGRGTTPAGPGGATADEPWHVLENVPEGHEEIPGLLRGLVTPGSRRASWDRLEPHLGWWRRPGILRPLLARLLVMLPELDRRHRIAVLDVVRRTADALRAGSHRPDALLEAVLVEGQRAAAALLSDDCPEVRAAAAGAVEHVRAADPAMFEALRRQADVESDPYVLGCHLLAAGEVLAALGTPAPADWWESWLHHADPHVRLTARTAHLTVGRAARPEEADARRGRSGRPAPHRTARPAPGGRRTGRRATAHESAPPDRYLGDGPRGTRRRQRPRRRRGRQDHRPRGHPDLPVHRSVAPVRLAGRTLLRRHREGPHRRR
ncbi:hypothetical protein [Streptomyces sp. NPDC017949]|uniref:hypothetical protein n=1 Tax=Streptomyces sp. NPDC017949 TaxID=3365020 RepID=UPI0037A01BF0